jgi:hypothetical protein
MAAARERLGKHVPVETAYKNEQCCLWGLCWGVIRKTTGATKSVQCGSLWRKEFSWKGVAVREDFSTEAEEQPLLEAVTRKYLENTLQAGKDLTCALENCSVEISDGPIIKCNYEFCAKVVNKSNIQSETPSRDTPSCDNIFTYLDQTCHDGRGSPWGVLDTWKPCMGSSPSEIISPILRLKEIHWECDNNGKISRTEEKSQTILCCC